MNKIKKCNKKKKKKILLEKTKYEMNSNNDGT